MTCAKKMEVLETAVRKNLECAQSLQKLVKREIFRCYRWLWWYLEQFNAVIQNSSRFRFGMIFSIRIMLEIIFQTARDWIWNLRMKMMMMMIIMIVNNCMILNDDNSGNSCRILEILPDSDLAWFFRLESC